LLNQAATAADKTAGTLAELEASWRNNCNQLRTGCGLGVRLSAGADEMIDAGVTRIERDKLATVVAEFSARSGRA
jgi:hypothetical protein